MTNDPERIVFLKRSEGVNSEDIFLKNRFGLAKNQQPERGLLHFYFRLATGAIPFTEELVNITDLISKIELRLNFLEEFEKSFFQDQKYERIPMVTAALYTTAIDLAFHPEHREDFEILDKDCPGLCKQAADINFEAELLLRPGIAKGYVAPREVLFCAHLGALEYAYEIDQNFDERSKQELWRFVEETIPAWMEFIDHDTELGKTLNCGMNYLIGKIHGKYPFQQDLGLPDFDI